MRAIYRYLQLGLKAFFFFLVFPLLSKLVDLALRAQPLRVENIPSPSNSVNKKA